MLEQRVQLWFGHIGDKLFLVALSFRLKYCKILDTTIHTRTYKPDCLSSTIQYVRPTASRPATVPATNGSHPTTNCRRSPAARHDASAAAGPATAADPSGGRQSRLDL